MQVPVFIGHIVCNNLRNILSHNWRNIFFNCWIQLFVAISNFFSMFFFTLVLFLRSDGRRYRMLLKFCEKRNLFSYGLEFRGDVGVKCDSFAEFLKGSENHGQEMEMLRKINFGGKIQRVFVVLSSPCSKHCETKQTRRSFEKKNKKKLRGGKTRCWILHKKRLQHETTFPLRRIRILIQCGPRKRIQKKNSGKKERKSTWFFPFKDPF